LTSVELAFLNFFFNLIYKISPLWVVLASLSFQKSDFLKPALSLANFYTSKHQILEKIDVLDPLTSSDLKALNCFLEILKKSILDGC